MDGLLLQVLSELTALKHQQDVLLREVASLSKQHASQSDW